MLAVTIACALLAALLAMLVIDRLHHLRDLRHPPIPARDLLPPMPGLATAIPVPVAAYRAAPGAPNTDPPTDRHVTPRGTAVITKRTGRRRSTTHS